MGAGAVVISIVLCAATLIVMDLVGVVDDGTDNAEESMSNGSWKGRFRYLRALLKSAIPLTTFRTIVVVWQIVSQVRV